MESRTELYYYNLIEMQIIVWYNAEINNDDAMQILKPPNLFT